MHAAMRCRGGFGTLALAAGRHRGHPQAGCEYRDSPAVSIRLEAVGRAGGAQRQEHDHQRGERHHSHLAAHDRRHHLLLIGLGQLPDGLGVLELALVEDRLGRGDTQLLGDERDRERQKRIQIEEPFSLEFLPAGASDPTARASASAEPWPTRNSTQKARGCASCAATSASRPSSAAMAFSDATPSAGRPRAHEPPSSRPWCDFEPIVTM